LPGFAGGVQGMGGIDGGDFAVLYIRLEPSYIDNARDDRKGGGERNSFRRACAREIGRFPQRRCPEDRLQRSRRPCVCLRAGRGAEVKTETDSKK